MSGCWWDTIFDAVLLEETICRILVILDRQVPLSHQLIERIAEAKREAW